MTRPIKPSEVADKKAKILPPEVFEAFNELITRDFDDNVATVSQSEVTELICSKLPTSVTPDHIHKHGWLNIEGPYRKEGWIVKYDEETSIFTFRCRKVSK